MLGVAGIDMFPSGFHPSYFGGIHKLGKEGFFKFFWNWARKHPSGVHLRIAGASKAKINHADDFVFFVEQNIAKV